MQVDQATETAEGVWYKRGNVETFLARERVQRIERSLNTKLTSLNKTPQVPVNWRISDSARVEKFFLARFDRPLPLTAFGQSELHNRWGLDHREGMDVGLHPDSWEGKVLIKFLRSEEIPFIAFRGAVPGVATGPHIHIGNPSHRFSFRRRPPI